MGYRPFTERGAGFAPILGLTLRFLGITLERDLDSLHNLHSIRILPRLERGEQEPRSSART